MQINLDVFLNGETVQVFTYDIKDKGQEAMKMQPNIYRWEEEKQTSKIIFYVNQAREKKDCKNISSCLCLLLGGIYRHSRI